MKPPVENVRISNRGKDILIKIKKRTGLDHWNEICRVALSRSLSNPTKPNLNEFSGSSAIEIEWKTFAGRYDEVLSALIIYRANKDEIDTSNKDLINEYVKAHLERGIGSLNIVPSLNKLLTL